MSGYNSKKRKSSSRSGSTGSVPSGGRTPTVTRGGSSRGSSLPIDNTGLGPLGTGFGSQPLSQSVDETLKGSLHDKWGTNKSFSAEGLDTNYINFLLNLLKSKPDSSELQTLILQQLLQQGANREQRDYDYGLTLDQRQYDWNLLQDSRLYNNPQNELARLMGAGISRDAALQLLSGSAGNAGAVGAGGSPVVTQPSAVPMSDTFGNQNIAVAQTALQGVQLVANLVAQGVDTASAIQQAQMLQAQNYMTQSQLQAFKGVNDISQAFDRAVFDGTLTVEDVQGLRTADDYYKWITDHAETNLVKPLVQSGAVNAAFGSTYGRQMMNHHLEQTRQGRDSGTLFDQFLQQQTAATELANLDVKKSYQELLYAIGELSRQDVEIQSLWNDVWLGNINIEIAGKELKLKTYQENQAKTYNDVFNVAYNQNTGDGTPDVRGLGTGAGHLAFSMWNDLTMQFYKAFAMNGTKERADSWEQFFLNHNQAAQLLAGLELNMAQIDSAAGNPDMNPFTSVLIAMWRIAKMTGAYDVMQFGTNTALEIYKSNNILTGMTTP